MWSARVESRAAASSVSASARGVEQVGEGALARAADPAADLVGLREAELVGALDDQRVGGRDVEAGLDDRRRHQAVGVAAQEARASSPPARARPSARGLRRSARPGTRPRSRSAISGSESIRLWRKKAWPSRSTSRSIALRDQLLVVGADVGADRAPALRRRLDHRDVAQPGEAHLQGARDRRRREREHVDLQLQLAQQLLLLDPEALLLVDDRPGPRSLARTSRESSRWVPIRMSTLPVLEVGERPL